jgi:cell wall assembly regulator SMI1
MTELKRYVLIAFTIVIAAFVTYIVYIMMLNRLREFFYPKPTYMPKVVEQPIEEVLKDLDAVLIEKAPLVANLLQPGLTPRKIDELEMKAGIELNDELRALYMWHNGCLNEANQDFIPGHLFPPLDTTIKQYIICKQQLNSEPLAQRLAFNIFSSHRKYWITVFDDLCGDGYFYDPNRKKNEGCIFYHLTEDVYYFFFPSLKNLLVAITECYRQGAYSQEPNSNNLKENYDHSKRIFAEFGVECY